MKILYLYHIFLHSFKYLLNSSFNQNSQRLPEGSAQVRYVILQEISTAENYCDGILIILTALLIASLRQTSRNMSAVHLYPKAKEHWME